MQQCANPSRITSGLIAGIAAALTLSVMSLNIGGLSNIASIFRDFGLLFSLTVLLALGCGIFLYKRRLRWSALVGSGIGLASGLGIVFYIVSRI